MSPETKSATCGIAEAAHELNVSPLFIRRRIADGSLRAFRIKGSRLIRIERTALEELKRPVGGGAA